MVEYLQFCSIPADFLMLWFTAIKSIVFSAFSSAFPAKPMDYFETQIYIFSTCKQSFNFTMHCYYTFLASDDSKTSKFNFDCEFCQLSFIRGDSYKRYIQILLQANVHLLKPFYLLNEKWSRGWPGLETFCLLSCKSTSRCLAFLFLEVLHKCLAELSR